MFGKIENSFGDSTAKYVAIDWKTLNQSCTVTMYLTNPSGSEPVEKEGEYLIIK